MEANEEIYIRNAWCSLEEDDAKKGGQGCIWGWNGTADGAIPIDEKHNHFGSIEEALTFLARDLGHDIPFEDWTYMGSDGENPPYFLTDLEVNPDLARPSKEELAKWNDGKLKLYCMSIRVELAVRSSRELTIEEIGAEMELPK